MEETSLIANLPVAAIELPAFGANVYASYHCHAVILSRCHLGFFLGSMTLSGVRVDVLLLNDYLVNLS